jgi:hypothetical protein
MTSLPRNSIVSQEGVDDAFASHKIEFRTSFGYEFHEEESKKKKNL